MIPNDTKRYQSLSHWPLLCTLCTPFAYSLHIFYANSRLSKKVFRVLELNAHKSMLFSVQLSIRVRLRLEERDRETDRSDRHWLLIWMPTQLSLLLNIQRFKRISICECRHSTGASSDRCRAFTPFVRTFLMNWKIFVSFKLTNRWISRTLRTTDCSP